MKDNYYYSQGFKLHRSIALVDFISTMGENKIVFGNRVKIYFKPGSKTEDFKHLETNKIKVEFNKTLKACRNLKLKPNILYFNNRKLKIYDLDPRIVSYIVAEDQESVLVEDSFSTTWVINHNEAQDGTLLKNIIDKSSVIEWESYPTGEFYSYTHNISETTTSDSSNLNTLNKAIAVHNNPINFKKYTKWRLEYSTVLLGFYETIQPSIIEDYDIYMNGNPLRCLNKQNSRRIDINFQGFGNMEKHPNIYEEDLHYNKAIISLKLMTPDQLEYMNLKKKYQNYKFLTDKVTFTVKDKQGLDWTSHIWWEPFEDMANLKTARNDAGQFSFNMELRCSLYYYEVEDPLYKIIDTLKVSMPESPNMWTKVYKFN